MYTTDLTRRKWHRSANKLYITTAFTLFIYGAAILDFELRVGEVLLTFLAGNPTSRSIPTDISDRGLGNLDFPVQTERTTNLTYKSFQNAAFQFPCPSTSFFFLIQDRTNRALGGTVWIRIKGFYMRLRKRFLVRKLLPSDTIYRYTWILQNCKSSVFKSSHYRLVLTLQVFAA